MLLITVALVATPPSALKLAPVLTGAPAAPYLDLGPVLVRQSPHRGATEVARELDVAAMQLGADAFIYERRDIREVYMLGVETTAEHVALNVVALLLAAVAGAGPALPVVEQPIGTRQTAYYRAIRYADPSPPKRDATEAPLPRHLQEQLAGADDLRGQLLQAHRWLLTGKLAPAAYAELRRWLAGTT